MIEAHDLPGADPRDDPYKETEDYTTRLILQQNESLIKAVKEMAVNIDRLSNFMPRQLAKEAPSTIDLGPLSGKGGAGTAAGAIWQSTTRWRITNVFLGGASGDNIRLKIGTLGYNFWLGGTMTFVPFEIEIDRGVDISVADITTPGATAWTFMLQGYPE